MSDADKDKMIISMLENIIETQAMIVEELAIVRKKAELGERAYEFQRPIG